MLLGSSMAELTERPARMRRPSPGAVAPLRQTGSGAAETRWHTGYVEREAADREWVRFRDFVRSHPVMFLLALIVAVCIVGNLLWWSVTQDRSQPVRIAVLLINGVAAVPGLVSLALGGWHARENDAPPRWWRWRSGVVSWLSDRTR
jgi:hypothetical protein